MKPTIEKEDSGFYKFNITLATERGIQVILAGITFGLITAWLLAGWKALDRWASFSYREPSESGWIIIWLIISAIIIGVFVALNDSKGGK